MALDLTTLKAHTDWMLSHWNDTVTVHRVTTTQVTTGTTGFGQRKPENRAVTESSLVGDFQEVPFNINKEYSIEVGGIRKNVLAVFYTKFDADILDNDVVTFDSQKYRVGKVNDQEDHKEVLLVEESGS